MSRPWKLVDRQRACAHVSDCLGTALRESEVFGTADSGPIGAAMLRLHSIYFIDSPADYYALALRDLGHSAEAVRAAVEAIEAGKLPANPRAEELVELRAIEASARAVMNQPAIIGGGHARAELVRLLDAAAEGRDLAGEQETTLGECLASAVADGVLAVEEGSPEKYKAARRKLLVYCEKWGVGAVRREMADQAFRDRVAAVTGPKKFDPVRAAASGGAP